MGDKWKNKNFFEASKNAFNGIKFVIKDARNIKIQFVFAVMVVIASIILKVNVIEAAILALTIFAVFAFEFINTAIEKVVDLYTLEYNEIAKIVKDVSAAAVVMMCIGAALVGIIIFLPKLLIYVG